MSQQEDVFLTLRRGARRIFPRFVISADLSFFPGEAVADRVLPAGDPRANPLHPDFFV